MINKMWVDERGFIWCKDSESGYYRLPMRWVPEQNALEFAPRFDHRRAGERGDKFVLVPVENLIALVQPRQDEKSNEGELDNE